MHISMHSNVSITNWNRPIYVERFTQRIMKIAARAAGAAYPRIGLGGSRLVCIFNAYRPMSLYACEKWRIVVSVSRGHARIEALMDVPCSSSTYVIVVSNLLR